MKRLRGDIVAGVYEAGCDEAGRGCLAGPVYAAAVILPHDFRHPLLNDSKKLTPEDRAVLRPIIEKESIFWAVAFADHAEIDEINILKASILSMHRALDQLKPVPGSVIVDGNYFLPWREVPYKCIVEGDAKYRSIAAASILAKTHRDEFMQRLHAEFPNYGWETNKGYATREHREALKIHGYSPYHRRSFNLLSSQLELEL